MVGLPLFVHRMVGLQRRGALELLLLQDAQPPACLPGQDGLRQSGIDVDVDFCCLGCPAQRGSECAFAGHGAPLAVRHHWGLDAFELVAQPAWGEVETRQVPYRESADVGAPISQEGNCAGLVDWSVGAEQVYGHRVELLENFQWSNVNG